MQLALERDAGNFKSAYTDVQVAFTQYRQGYVRDNWDKAYAAQGNLHNAVNRLDSLARAQLAELDQPIPPLASSTSEPPASAIPPAAPIRWWQLRRWWRSRRQPAVSEAGQAGA